MRVFYNRMVSCISHSALLILFLLQSFASLAITEVTPASGGTNICYGGAYVTLGDIRIAEGNFNDFAASLSPVTYELSAPDNFHFQAGVGTVHVIGNNITALSIDVATSKITVTYTLTSTSTGPVDGFIIRGIRVGSSAVSSGQILRSGGTAVQSGNLPESEGGQVSHGNLISHNYNPLPVANAGSDQIITLASSTEIGTDPTAGYLYEWHPAIGLSSTTSSKPIASPQETTVYSLIVTDPNGCTDSDQVTVTVEPNPLEGPVITSSGPGSICNGENVILYSSEATGNQWYRNGLALESATGASLVVSTAGDYSVTYYNGSITSNPSELFNVTVNPIPANRTVVAEKENLCYLGSTFIELRTSVNNISYQLRIGSTEIGLPRMGNGGSIYFPTGSLTAGNYTYNVLATNPNTLCTRVMADNPTVQVEPQIPNPVITVDPSQTICGEGSIKLSANEGFDNYIWYRNDVFYSSSTSNELLLENPAASGNFRVRMFKTSPVVCQSNLSNQVDIRLYLQPGQKNVEVEKSMVCKGESTKIILLESEMGILYTLKNGVTDATVGAAVAGTGNAITMPTGNLSENTSFRILAVNGLTGCSVEMTTQPTVQINPDLSVTASTVTPEVCLDGYQIIKLNAALTGGTGEKMVLWTGPEGFTSDLLDPFPIVPETSGDHVYKVEVTDEIGCKSISEITVKVYPIPAIHVYNNAENNTLCLGDVVKFTAFGAESFEFRIDGSIVQAQSTVNTFSTDALTNGQTVCVKGFNSYGCASFTAEEVFVVHEKPESFFTGLNDEYCINDGIQVLSGIPSGGIFIGRGMRGNEFIPEFAGTGTHIISYTQQNTNGCDSIYLKTVVVKASPEVDFSFTAACLGDQIQFQDLSPNPSGIESWEWDFGDGSPMGNIQNPSHVYATHGTYHVTLKVTAITGCSSSRTKEVIYGEIPQPEFSYSKFCNSNYTVFNDLTITENVVAYSWNFDDPASGAANISTLKNPEHLFSEAGIYEVSLSVETNLGCFNEIVKTVHIVPSFGANSFPYHEDFETSDGGWIAEGQNSSWVHQTPMGNAIKTAGSGIKAWSTQSNNNSYNNNEQSYVLSPCFDFSTLNRPMISLKIFSHTDKAVDGTVMQYSIDNGITWVRLGNIGEGIGWYNQGSIISQPGGFSIGQEGWSGKDTGWKIAKFNLDHLKNQPSVRFRVAFASLPNNAQRTDHDGFAFDDIFIGERTRVILLEHFTNATKVENEEADLYVNNLTTNNLQEVISIHYHTDKPFSTPLNKDNTADPSVRSQYYGISQTPRAVLDGNYFNGKSTDWTQNHLKHRSLMDPVFDVEISLPPSGIEEVIVEAKITALQNFSDELVVHIAIVEDEVFLENGKMYRNVLKKLLPDGAGTILREQWNSGTHRSVNGTWIVDKLYGNGEKPLKVIVYVQNNVTKEILQASHIQTLPKRNRIATSTDEDKQVVGEGILQQFSVNVYPVPGKDDVFCKFNIPLVKELSWLLFDQRGILLKKGLLESGSTELLLDVRQYSSGMYFIRFSTHENEILNKKIIIRH